MIEIINAFGEQRKIPIQSLRTSAWAPLPMRSASAEKESFVNAVSPYGSMAPGHDVSREFAEMKQQLNGHGGSVDQSFFYFDYQSGADWEQVSKESGFFNISGSLPSPWLVNLIATHVHESKFDKQAIQFVSLGCGDGNYEIQLICNLLNQQHFQVTLHLVDLSHYLLNRAYREATTVLGRRGVRIYPLEGNFYHLPRLPLLFNGVQEQPRQLRVGCFFGNTFGNLSDEVRFIQDSLSAFHSGDLFVLHVGTTYAPADQPEVIKSMDPRFINYPGQELWEQWLCGPLMRYRKDLRKLELKTTLDTSTGPVEGSYTVAIQAIINDDIQLKLMRVTRYVENMLVRKFNELGWQSLGGRHFGEDKKRICYVFEKQ